MKRNFTIRAIPDKVFFIKDDDIGRLGIREIDSRGAITTKIKTCTPQFRGKNNQIELSLYSFRYGDSGVVVSLTLAGGPPSIETYSWDQFPRMGILNGKSLKDFMSVNPIGLRR